MMKETMTADGSCSMTEPLALIRGVMLDQRATSDLVRLPVGLMDQVDRELGALKTQFQVTGDESIRDHHEAIVTALGELQETRADIIWALAYSQSGDTSAMSPTENRIFQTLVDMAACLRGIV